MKKYWVGVFFLLLSMCVSCMNDIICKFMGQRLDSFEIIFFRFFFGFITLLPFVFRDGLSIFKTNQLSINVIRGIFGAFSFFLCTYSVIKLPLVEVTTILWVIPLFQLVLSSIFLSERVFALRWIATLVGFIGLSFVTLYNSGSSISLNPLYIFPVGAALLFATQDIMIKKVVATEGRITMLLYFALIASTVSFVPMCFVWNTPTAHELAMLFLLGIGGNLIQYFIFKAFNATDVSALAPYRYIEFILSACFAFVFFREIPGLNVIIGAAILVPCTLFLAYNEQRKESKAQAN